MPELAAIEAETVFDAMFLLLGGHLGDTYDINIHGIGVFGRFRWSGGMIIGLSDGTIVLLDNQISSLPLGLEVNSFSIPGDNGIRRGIHGVDLPHKSMRDARGEVPDEDIIISNSREDGARHFVIPHFREINTLTLIHLVQGSHDLDLVNGVESGFNGKIHFHGFDPAYRVCGISREVSGESHFKLGGG